MQQARTFECGAYLEPFFAERFFVLLSTVETVYRSTGARWRTESNTAVFILRADSKLLKKSRIS